MPEIISHQARELTLAAIAEDFSTASDVSAALLPIPSKHVSSRVVPRQPGIIAGLTMGIEVVREFNTRLHDHLEFVPSQRYCDGAFVELNAEIAKLSGPLRAVLTAERTLLNFLCRMSGVATLTRKFVDRAKAANPTVNIYDTRKTIPGWRELDKYAVRCGGGCNHRFGLYDAVLLKDNHIAGIPPAELAKAISAMLCKITGQPKFVEVEVDTLEQLHAVLGVDGVNIILLDNFTLADMKTAVSMRDAAGARGRVELEASGGVTLETVADIASTGVDRIAVGAITHSAPALDIGLDL
ncbi:MAG: carboxylating nicotinate-nucleotide diphosphorylase [Phycisphaerales bacterium]|nr:carboxylating nicotinate-nucleotide diphosphorylase [Phycisphaerales bacterium]